MALNFPSSPSEGQKFSNFVFSGGLWKSSATPRTALPFNYIVNPSMQVSAQNINTAGTLTNRYGADQWYTTFTGTGVIKTQRMQVATPNGSKDRYRMTIQNTDPSLSATDFAVIRQYIEGNRVADLLLGTANARQIVIRFGFRGPSGTYAFWLRNDASTRCYVSLFTISAGQGNTDTEQIIVIPGDTTGTWLKDTGIGVGLGVCLAAGSSYLGTNNAWNNGNFFGVAGMTNGLALPTAEFDVFDFGLYADPYLTGLPPPWETVGDLKATIESMRYYNQPFIGVGVIAAATSIGRSGGTHPIPQRIAPVFTRYGSSSALAGATIGSFTVMGTTYPTTTSWEFDGTIATSFTVPYGGITMSGMASNARM